MLTGIVHATLSPMTTTNIYTPCFLTKIVSLLCDRHKKLYPMLTREPRLQFMHLGFSKSTFNNMVGGKCHTRTLVFYEIKEWRRHFLCSISAGMYYFCQQINMYTSCVVGFTNQYGWQWHSPHWTPLVDEGPG